MLGVAFNSSSACLYLRRGGLVRGALSSVMNVRHC